MDRALRWGVTWYLSGALGAAAFGTWSWAVAVATVVTVFSPLGLDSGVVMFGARYRRSGDREGLKGVLLVGAVVTVAVGLLSGLGLYLSAGMRWLWPPALGHAVRAIAPAVGVWTPLVFVVGVLRGAKDLRNAAIAYNIAVPAALCVGSVVAVEGLHLGLAGALWAVVVAYAVGLVVGTVLAEPYLGRLLRDRAVRARIELGRLLGFSLPQSLTAAVFRLNLLMDQLMLAWLAQMSDVGIYKVAVSLAMLGLVPSAAVTAAFNPHIAELVYVNELDRLDRLLKTVTRWLVIVVTPGFMALLLLPDVILRIYDASYQASAGPLVVLVFGQAVVMATTPTIGIIPMSGRAVLNLVNGVVALVMNVVLNAVLIPRYGASGAALATGLALAAWSAWRVAETRWLFGVFPFSRRTWGLVLVSFLATGMAALFTHELTTAWRVGGAAVAVAVHVVACWRWGRRPEDAELIVPLRRKVAGLLRR